MKNLFYYQKPIIQAVKGIFVLFLNLSFIFLLSCNNPKSELTTYVDPFIGTDAHGHVYPGAALPFGMVQLSPDTRKDNWDACSGYHYSDSTIMGFSHTHLSGTGVGDYGDIRFMPTTGEIQLDPGTEENPESGYRSRFSHKSEKATPGFYSVKLEDYDIAVELTTAYRTGFHKYIFPKSDESNIIIDLTEGVTSDRITELWIEFASDTEIRGLRRTEGWARDQYVFFNAEFSMPFKSFGISVNGEKQEGLKKAEGKNIKAWVTFDTKKTEEVLAKVGISAVSADGAKNNRINEITGWDFEQVKIAANQAWLDELSRITVESKDENRKAVFYTALYHALLNPNLYSDFDGKYRGHDMQIHQADGFNMYTVFSLWDTFRAAHPLFTIIDQKRTNDFINSMLAHYEQGGLLPVWELAANETNCMIGYHAIPVIVDAYIKGINGYNAEKALDACIKSASQNQFGLEFYKTKGYIPASEESESVSKTLEYAYDDWCIAQFAKALNRENDYQTFIKRGQNYKNIFDPETKFMRAKTNESWFKPFDPAEVNFNYTEANSWQYSFFVPQDISGLMELLGGSDSLAKRLDQLFSVSSETTGRQQSDITGLIGQYAHGNEPSHHMAYLYNYAGKPWKAQETVRKIMDELYHTNPDGLCGNEDCGQMSAWYVLSAMGFYPVTPGSNIYSIGSPVFDKVTLNLENGKQFIIKAKGNSTENKYIQAATHNENGYSKSFFTHADIMAGGNLTFEMGNNPNQSWGTGDGNIPVSAINDHLISSVPFVKSGEKVFHQQQNVEFASIDPSATIEYFSETKNSKSEILKYSEPIQVNNSVKMTAFARNAAGEESFKITAEFTKIPEGRTISIKNPYKNQYSAGGDIALIDFLRGSSNFRTGVWQGYEGVDVEAVIDLGKSEKISKLTTGFLQDINAWVFMPLSVEYLISDDGKTFKKVGLAENTVAENDWNTQTKDFTISFKPQNTRFIKMIGKNRGVCPAWHKGAGNPAWLFADEVVIE
jgi:predicted alpha-1,2-mannosidase